MIQRCKSSHLYPICGASIVALVLLGCGEATTPSSPTVHPLPVVAAAGSTEAHLATIADEAVIMSWIEPEGEGVALRWSELNGKQWSTPVTIAAGDNWFVNWADFPSVEPINDTVWAAHWLVKKPGGTYAYDVTMAISRDSGAAWSEPFVPHQDGTATEHGFVSLFPWQGDVGALWLDGRKTQAEGEAHGHGGGMTLRAAAIDAELAPRNKTEVDGLVCDCCQTDVAIAASGPVAVYRNRTEDEIRDIYVARSINGDWKDGVAIANDGWEIAGCPVNGPAITAEGKHIGVAWFTAARGETKIRFAYSLDSGATFVDAIDISLDRPIGRVDTVLLADGSALVSWLRSAQGTAGDIVVRSVSADGELGPVHVIAATAAGRMSGFPQMVLRGEDVIFAWTDVNDTTTQVHTAIARAETLRPH